MENVKNKNVLNELQENSYSKPVDFSFKKLKEIKAIGLESARYTRVSGIPERGPNKKFLTKSIWLNNNNLTTTKNINVLVDATLEYPNLIGWIDFSFNYIREIDESLLKFSELKILYFHGNCINQFEEISKLKQLKKLRCLTLHGNPISNHPKYRNFVIATLPQLVHLDFSPVIKTERQFPLATGFTLH